MLYMLQNPGKDCINSAKKGKIPDNSWRHAGKISGNILVRRMFSQISEGIFGRIIEGILIEILEGNLAFIFGGIPGKILWRFLGRFSKSIS